MPEGKMSVERRANPRVSIKIPIKYRLEDNSSVLRGIEEWRQTEKNGYTLDMSTGGMHIAVDQPLKVGEIIKFDVYLLDPSNVVSIYAEVIRVSKEGAGLHFLMMKNNDMETLKAFLDKASSA